MSLWQEALDRLYDFFNIDSASEKEFEKYAKSMFSMLLSAIEDVSHSSEERDLDIEHIKDEKELLIHRLSELQERKRKGKAA